MTPTATRVVCHILTTTLNDQSEIVAVYDHGYSGRPRNWPYSAFSVDVSATEYKYYKCFKPLHSHIESVAKLLTTPIPEPYGKEVCSMSATKDFYHDCASAGFIPCGNDVFKRLEDLEDQLGFGLD